MRLNYSLLSLSILPVIATTLSPPCLVLNATFKGNADSLNARISLPIIVQSTLRDNELSDLANCLYVEALEALGVDRRLP